MIINQFEDRHLGPAADDIREMCNLIGVASADELIDKTIPPSIRLSKPLSLPDGISEYEYFQRIRAIASKNKIFKTFIGLGYYGTIFPAVIQRNILENPSWYTSYTPYQAEISQGRLEALLNYQTAIMELTGMELANASLLDEGTAAAEAMIMLFNARPREQVKKEANEFFVDENIFPQTLDVLKTRAVPLGIKLFVGRYKELSWNEKLFGLLVQYPCADGSVHDYKELVEKAHANGTMVTVAADILGLALLTPPGEWDADVVVGSSQRLGIPMGYGGPHAGYFATRDAFRRNLPGRIIGVSIDISGRPALRMALQTREQHIKRERATSNICTAQALLATMAGMYAVYHGEEGLKNIASRIHCLAGLLTGELVKLGYTQLNKNFFDTLKVALPKGVDLKKLEKIALANEVNFRYTDKETVGISLDETTTMEDVGLILRIFAEAASKKYTFTSIPGEKLFLEGKFVRSSRFLTQDVFKRYRSETEMMRYIKKLERKDFSLTHSMISLGSCTMKLNAAIEMLPLSWPEFAVIHPFVPEDQAAGYHELFRELASDLCAITGFEAVSLQPNSGAAGEYAGLMVIRAYHEHRGEGHRKVVLIPASAHGTNPASAVMAGNEVVVVDCDQRGNVNLDCLKRMAAAHKERLAAFMVTYPSTHGVFEHDIKEMIQVIHDNGGLVYMDGANMNAQVGYTNPAIIGADVCHLNLHKTFAIPHGGGGPGMGPIAVNSKLVPFLPGHPVVKTGGNKAIHAVASAPYGSASILTISHAYIKMMGGKGLTQATKIAILNANYIAAALKKHYEVLYSGEHGFVAHEMILECRNFKPLAGITEADIAKRLMDFGFHAPTLSFPVHGTLMVEPTESESKAELDRFIEALKTIHAEIMEISEGKADAQDNVLKNAPHTMVAVTANEWKRPYARTKAAYPLPWVTENKFWPSVGRIDDAYGDRNLVCSCAPIEAFRDQGMK
jgi:glycine dehydrogenase